MVSDRPRLMLAEDDPQLGPLIAQVLEETYSVDLIVDGAVALERARTEAYDVLVIDWRLPGLDGVSVIDALRRAGRTTPAIMLTALGALDNRVRGLDAGADDYLVKPFEFDELFARLRAIRRLHGTDARVVHVGEWEFSPATRVVHSPTGERTELTEREAQLLGLFMQHPRSTFTRQEILHAVFAKEDTPGTVDTYVHYLRRKTEPGLIDTVRGRGYRLGEL